MCLNLIEKINYTYDILPKFYSLSIILSHIVELIQKIQLFQVTLFTTLSLKYKIKVYNILKIPFLICCKII